MFFAVFCVVGTALRVAAARAVVVDALGLPRAAVALAVMVGFSFAVFVFVVVALVAGLFAAAVVPVLRFLGNDDALVVVGKRVVERVDR